METLTNCAEPDCNEKLPTFCKQHERKHTSHPCNYPGCTKLCRADRTVCHQHNSEYMQKRRERESEIRKLTSLAHPCKYPGCTRRCNTARDHCYEHSEERKQKMRETSAAARKLVSKSTPCAEPDCNRLCRKGANKCYEHR